MSCLQIARRLNEMGVPAPTRYLYNKGVLKSQRYAHVLWNSNVIRQMLENELYLGHMVQGRRRCSVHGVTKQQKVAKSDLIIVRNTHTPLIDQDTFAAVQQTAAERRTDYFSRIGRYDGLGSKENILRGLAFCADCGRPLVRHKTVTGHGKYLYYVYQCPTHSEDPSSCPRKNIHEEQLIELLKNLLAKEAALARSKAAHFNHNKQNDRVIKETEELKQKETAALNAIDRAALLYDSVYQNYVDKLITESEYRELKEHYRIEKKQAEARLDEIRRKRSEVCAAADHNDWIHAFTGYSDELELTKDIAHALIGKIEVYSTNRIKVFLLYRDEYKALSHAPGLECKQVTA